MENYQLIYERLHPETKDFSFMTVLEDFVHTVEVMEETVLIPSLLMNLHIDSIVPRLESFPKLFLQEETDLKSFYSMARSLKTHLVQECKFFVKEEEPNGETRKKMSELCESFTPLIYLARFIVNAGQEIALSGKVTTTFQAFQRSHYINIPISLLGTLHAFVRQVKEMENEVLFQCFLFSYKASDLGWRSDSVGDAGGSEDYSLHDWFVHLSKLRQILLDSHAPNETCSILHKKLEELRGIFYCLTAMIDKLVDIYRDEVHESC